jgi:uncharacterized protein (UPF0335 family)
MNISLHGAAVEYAEHGNNQLRSIVERVERVMMDRAALTEEIKEIFAEAKGNGYDVPTLKRIVKMRADDDNKRVEAEALLATYMHALGMDKQLDLGV